MDKPWKVFLRQIASKMGTTRALVSVDGVENSGGDVDLVQADTITIAPDDANNTITIGETHSARVDNPHQTTAALVGAIDSINIVNHDGTSAGTVNPNNNGDIELSEGDNINITPGANSLEISATGGTGLETDLTTLDIVNWSHGGSMPLAAFMNILGADGLRVRFLREGQPDQPARVNLGSAPDEIFLVAVKTPLFHRDNTVKTYHYEYLPGNVSLQDDDTVVRFGLVSLDIPAYRNYLEQILQLDSEDQLTILVQLKCDFIRDSSNGKAVDGSHASRIGASGLIWDGDGYVGGIRGRVFESWFGVILEPRP